MRSRLPTVVIASVVAVLTIAPMVAAVGSGGARSFSQLRADATAIPVPHGVAFVRESLSLEDGPGFTTKKFEQVSRVYRNSLACSTLERAWDTDLRRAHRKFRRWDYPHMFAGAGQFGITILDRPEHLGITLGQESSGTKRCQRPFIYAFNDPH